jgi:hypothetical protein
MTGSNKTIELKIMVIFLLSYVQGENEVTKFVQDLEAMREEKL